VVEECVVGTSAVLLGEQLQTSWTSRPLKVKEIPLSPKRRDRLRQWCSVVSQNRFVIHTVTCKR